jgi:hypothetical protein
VGWISYPSNVVPEAATFILLGHAGIGLLRRRG